MLIRKIALFLLTAAAVVAVIGANRSEARDVRGSIETPNGSVRIQIGDKTVEFGNHSQSVELRLRALERAVATLYAQQGYQVQQPTVWECNLTPFTDSHVGQGPTENAARSAAAKVCRDSGRAGMFCEPRDAECMQLQ